MEIQDSCQKDGKESELRWKVLFTPGVVVPPFHTADCQMCIRGVIQPRSNFIFSF